MENILAVVALFALVGFFWFFLSKIIDYRRQKIEAEDKRQRLIAEHLLEVARETRKRERQRRTEQIAASIKNSPPEPKPLNTVGSGVNVGRATYAPSPTQSVNSYNDNFMSDVAMGMVINSLLNSNHSSQSGTVTEDRATGAVSVNVKESSWGFDDSDSRKSISSSMDTSSSWSSSDSSSSSDSGPSSDW